MIIPNYNTNDVPYHFDFDDKGIPHSYPINPIGYYKPQILYTFSYEGILDIRNNYKNYIWSVEPPFYILSGQSTREITCELIPILTKQREPIKTAIRKLIYRDLNYCELNLEVEKWKETLNLYYKKGPLWKIDGNRQPKLNSIESYTLIPQYDQTGYPPKYSTSPNLIFNIRNGKVINFYGTVNNPIVDVLWYNTGSSYLSFYSSWTDEKDMFPNTLDIIVI